MSSTFLQQAIAEQSSRHTQLLHSLSELANIPNEVKDQTERVDQLQSELGKCEENVAVLFEKTRSQRRTADPGLLGGVKLSNVFRGRKEREREREREERNKRLFQEAMEEETRERNRKTSLEQDLNKAEVLKSELLTKMKDYDDVMGKIEALYGLIFNGPTPGFPREDEAEQAVQAALSVVERTRAEFNQENEAHEILSRSDRTFRECQTKLKDAIYWATASMLAGGRTAEVKETASLRIAHTLAQKAQSLVRDAQQFSAHVRTLENPSIARELPVRKENDTEFHETLKALAADLGNTYSQLLSERQSCATRAAECKSAVLESEQAVSDRKKELFELRKSLFLDVVAKLKSGEIEEPSEEDIDWEREAPPPSYEQQQSHPPPNPASASASSSSPMPVHDSFLLFQQQQQQQQPSPLMMMDAHHPHAGHPPPPSLFIPKQEPSSVGVGGGGGHHRQFSPSPTTYDTVGPSSPSSVYAPSAYSSPHSNSHSSFYYSTSPPPPTTPSTARPGTASSRSRGRPLPRVPQPNGS